MPSTPTVQNTLNWIYGLIVGRPTTGVGGFTGEPGLTSANLTAQTILAPPFAWNWNRSSTTFSTVVGQSDYPVSLANYGWLEKGTIFNNTLNPTTYELEVKNIVAADGSEDQPRWIAPVFDNNAGTITFRLFPRPDLIYTTTLTYQLAPPTLTLGGTWAPIPDKYAFLYERGLLAMLKGMYNSQEYLADTQLFFRQLVAASEGLTETEKAIFLEEKFRDLRAEQIANIAPAQGRQARG